MRAQDFYRGLASLLRAGVVFNEAVEQLARDGTIPLAVSLRIGARIESGEGPAKALADFPEIFAAEEVAMLEAGERTGRLDATLDRLADLTDERARMWRGFRHRLGYPALIFHVAALVMPIGILGLSGFASGASLTITFLALAAFWSVAAAIWFAARRPDWRTRLRELLEPIPGFGTAARHQRRAVFAGVLEAAHETGVTLDVGTDLAARASGTPEAASAARAIAGGTPLGTALAESKVMPAALTTRIAIAERAGELSEELRRIATEESEAAERSLDRAVAVTSQGFYVLMALGVLFYALAVLSKAYGG